LERSERHPGAASSALGRYRRLEPEQTVLHAFVRDHLEGSPPHVSLAAARVSLATSIAPSAATSTAGSSPMVPPPDGSLMSKEVDDVIHLRHDQHH
jgi:hypothetical protein